MRRVLSTSLLTIVFWFTSIPMAFALEDSQLAVWANEAIVATYSYDASHFMQKQQNIARYFTTEGWIAYSKVLHDSKIPEEVKKNNYTVSAVATLPPKITPIDKNQWEAVMPILVLFKNPQYQQKQNLEVTIRFNTAPSDQGVRGLAISSLQAKVSAPPCECCPAEKP